SEVGLLKRELRKKRRHLPVRKLLDQTQHLTPRLKPCFLMSPLSVAQYLDAGDSPFDLVVFDEASQIAPWDAVGAIARGSHCVVVGDSRQLPPTSFFQTMDGEEFGDDEDIEDLESILDEFSAAGFRALDLEWHYRSRHESLIAFSNHHYYENRLLTFPSPAEDVDGMGLSVKPVPDGVYDRSKSRTNRKEAESVVEDLCSRLRAGTDNSLGVVTFSMAQRELIEDLLDVERRKSPELERFFSVDVEEPVFVKNLENVQGDERDVILFSIGYGPDASGKVSMHFGPLNLSGGERRLNVAVTRARRQIVVHSTLRADQIDLRRTQAEGVKGLKNFLEYAERGSAALSAWAEEVGPGEAESPFEAEVAAALRARGHDVAYQVGCSGYRIDLAIRDPEAPGRFVLGIECDGANYHSAKTARDRDRIRESVLRGLGWEICRIWSTDWWRHPAREIERVEAALERAKAIFRDARAREAIEAKAVSEPERFASSVTADHAGDEGEGAPEEAASEVVTEDQASIGVDEVREVSPSPGRRLTYQSTPSSQLGTNEQFFTPASDGALREFAGRVLELEAPIVERLLQRRLVDAFEQRLTKKARDRVADVLAALPEAVRPRMHEGAYWRPDQDPLQFAIYRVPDESSEDPREADEIPVIETVNAALDLVQASIALPKDELVREMARQFGFARLGSRVEVAMTSGVDTALAKGALILKSDGSVVVAG
ncbi:MAG: AAA domain-containing protein, partial [Planctomycetota bacterium]